LGESEALGTASGKLNTEAACPFDTGGGAEEVAGAAGNLALSLCGTFPSKVEPVETANSLTDHSRKFNDGSCKEDAATCGSATVAEDGKPERKAGTGDAPADIPSPDGSRPAVETAAAEGETGSVPDPFEAEACASEEGMAAAGRGTVNMPGKTKLATTGTSCSAETARLEGTVLVIDAVDKSVIRAACFAFVLTFPLTFASRLAALVLAFAPIVAVA